MVSAVFGQLEEFTYTRDADEVDSAEVNDQSAARGDAAIENCADLVNVAGVDVAADGDYPHGAVMADPYWRPGVDGLVAATTRVGRADGAGLHVSNSGHDRNPIMSWLFLTGTPTYYRG